MFILNSKNRLCFFNDENLFIITYLIIGIFLLYYNLLRIITHFYYSSIYLAILDVVTMIVYLYILILIYLKGFV